MSDPRSSPNPYLLSDPSLGAKANPLPLATTILLASFVAIWFALNSRKSEYPLANPPSWFQTKLSKRIEFMTNGLEILSEAKARYGDKPYRLLTEYGEILVISIHDLRHVQTEKNLNFGKAIYKDFHAQVPGLQPFAVLSHEKAIMQNIVKKHLTKSIGDLTTPLLDEIRFAVDLTYGKSPEWKEAGISQSLFNLVSRVSSRIFLGEELCRDEAWLRITQIWTEQSFKAVMNTPVFPNALKFLLPWLKKDYKDVLQLYSEACAVIKPVIEKRKQIKAEAKRKGEPIPVYNDALEWGELESQGSSYVAHDLQLLLSFAAIHTTTNMAGLALGRLAQDPYLVTLLREEMISVLKADGLNKNSIYNLRLLDSMLKEVQRIAPDSRLNMRRLATRDFVTSNGIKVKKGQEVVVDCNLMHDPEVYPDPTKFDIYRYYNMRQNPATAAKSQFVSTSAENTGFGHGNHACPGRFFAALEIKIIFCYLLLNYDWELSPGSSVDSLCIVGTSMVLNPANKLRFRRRKAELDLDSLVTA